LSALLTALVASSASHATAADVKYQLEGEINRRFTVAEEVTPPKPIIDSAFRLTRTLKRPYPSPIILDFSFPAGETGKEDLRDDSYHLAPGHRGVTMRFEDERLLVAGQTFYR
jgi:hypothetical protein